MKAAVFPDPVGAQHNTSLFYEESNSGNSQLQIT